MNRIFTLFRLSVVVTLLITGAPAAALDAYFSGFGTASISCFSNDEADFIVNDQPKGPGRTSRCDEGSDSLLGLQLDLEFSESVEFGLQLVSDRNEDSSFTPDVTVGQLRWRPTDELTLRLGRMPADAFLHAENRQVRYSMPWVRPPLEVYSLVPVASQDGLEFIYESNLGHWRTELHGGFTRFDVDVPLSNVSDTFPVETFGPFLNLVLADRNTLFKIGYAYKKTTITLPHTEALFDALRSFVFPDGAQLADDLEIDDSPTHRFGIGVSHERGDWLAMAEFGYRSIEGFFRDQYGAYTTLGRRIGPWMPYTTLARRWTSGPDKDGRAGFLEPAVEGLLAGTRFDTTSVSLGLSREITEQATLKFQTDWIRPDKNSWGMYSNHAPDYDFADPGSDWLFTLSLDFVF